MDLVYITLTANLKLVKAMLVVAQTHRLLTSTKALSMKMAIACTLDV